MGDAIGTGRRCLFRPSSRRLDDLKLHLFTFSFTYTGLSVHRNFVLLPVSMASPINDSAYFRKYILGTKMSLCHFQINFASPSYNFHCLTIEQCFIHSVFSNLCDGDYPCKQCINVPCDVCHQKKLQLSDYVTCFITHRDLIWNCVV